MRDRVAQLINRSPVLSAAKDEIARDLLQTPGIALCRFPIE